MRADQDNRKTLRVENNAYFDTVLAELAEGRRVRLIAVGKSMERAIRNGEPIVIEAAREKPEVGEVVLFRYGGGYRLHRIVKLQGERCTMRGDNCIGTEEATVANIVARLIEVPRIGPTDGKRWQRASRWSMARGCAKRTLYTWLCTAEGRRKLRPWYFAALAFFMWAPLNGLGIPLNNYVLGLRADHLLHASVYLPCALMLADLWPEKRQGAAWVGAMVVGITTESVQWLLPWRGFDINDMVANIIGASLGWLIAKTILNRKR